MGSSSRRLLWRSWYAVPRLQRRQRGRALKNGPGLCSRSRPRQRPRPLTGGRSPLRVVRVGRMSMASQLGWTHQWTLLRVLGGKWRDSRDGSHLQRGSEAGKWRSADGGRVPIFSRGSAPACGPHPVYCGPSLKPGRSRRLTWGAGPSLRQAFDDAHHLRRGHAPSPGAPRSTRPTLSMN